LECLRRRPWSTSAQTFCTRHARHGSCNRSSILPHILVQTSRGNGAHTPDQDLESFKTILRPPYYGTPSGQQAFSPAVNLGRSGPLSVRSGAHAALVHSHWVRETSLPVSSRRGPRLVRGDLIWSEHVSSLSAHGAPRGAKMVQRFSPGCSNAGSIHDWVARRVETARISPEYTPGSRLTPR